MSRPKSIDSLLNGPASEFAPTVTDLSNQKLTEPTAEPNPEPAKKAKQSPGERKTKAPAQSSSKTPTPIRFQISAPEGGEVERALGDILASVPEALRSGISIGALFRQVMIDNDAEIAAMIRKSVGGTDQ
ncbi:hypothetical protein RA27_17480 [Ruegeria sp. ANG-R]|uniref:hypothetical protein n=1 Tax=Ruegeria sp. ANG-R TaxID=1577903 RepID=UPI00057D19FA|nr:hypothetical protein [Ruegeria sp. ANG-R]KIC39840.1 hypothetical protein RA27_17480 [Ruegeria sp. ANG-R]